MKCSADTHACFVSFSTRESAAEPGGFVSLAAQLACTNIHTDACDHRRWSGFVQEIFFFFFFFFYAHELLFRISKFGLADAPQFMVQAPLSVQRHNLFVQGTVRIESFSSSSRPTAYTAYASVLSHSSPWSKPDAAAIMDSFLPDAKGDICLTTCLA